MREQTPGPRKRSIGAAGAAGDTVQALKSIPSIAMALLALLAPSASRAQSPAEFYKGKTIELAIGTSVGGGYDAYGRMLARSMGKYIPGNPTIVPRNMEGAGGVRLASHLYNTAPKDGTAFGTMNRSA